MKLLFIVNPIAGAGAKGDVVDKIRRNIDQKRFECTFVNTERPGHAEELAASSDADVVVAVGGDGTVNEVARGALRSGRAMGIIPCGSGNGLALHLGISLNPAKATRQLNGAAVRSMDSAEINGIPFFSVCGVGLDADVAWDYAQSGTRGLRTYIKCLLRLWSARKAVKYHVTTESGSFTLEALIVTAGNSDQWGNNARITPWADEADGLLDITAIPMISSLYLPVMALRLMTGRLYKCRCIKHFRCSSITLEAEDAGGAADTGSDAGAFAGAAHFDGEPFRPQWPVCVRLLPGSLKIFV